MNEVVLIAFSSILTLLGTIVVFQFKGIREDLSQMNKSVEILNQQIAVVIKDQEWHKEEIDFIKQRLSSMEGK